MINRAVDVNRKGSLVCLHHQMEGVGMELEKRGVQRTWIQRRSKVSVCPRHRVTLNQLNTPTYDANLSRCFLERAISPLRQGPSLSRLVAHLLRGSQCQMKTP